jgi:hypothetical protein
MSQQAEIVKLPYSKITNVDFWGKSFNSVTEKAKEFSAFQSFEDEEIRVN